MSHSSSYLHEELHCPICHSFFVDPVSTPCGHNFCKTCIEKKWGNAKSHQCPECEVEFDKGLKLKINKSFEKIVYYFKRTKKRSQSFPCLQTAFFCHKPLDNLPPSPKRAASINGAKTAANCSTPVWQYIGEDSTGRNTGHSSKESTSCPVGRLVDVGDETKSNFPSNPKNASSLHMQSDPAPPSPDRSVSRNGDKTADSWRMGGSSTPAGQFKGEEATERWANKGPQSVCRLDDLKRALYCHMQLDPLTPSLDHTVLISTSIFCYYQKLEPHAEHQKLDGNHVKLPHLFPRERDRAPRWESIGRALGKLAKKGKTIEDVKDAIMSYNYRYKNEWNFDALEVYVGSLAKHENNFPEIIRRMATLALELPNLIKKAIPLLRQNRNHSITLSQVQISCLLANAFFCTFPHRNSTQPNSEYSNFPTINFSSLFGNASKQKTEKLRAIFHYFSTVTAPDANLKGLVTFERRCLADPPNWREEKDELTRLYISPDGSIEREGDGMLQVDFASKFVGGGVLGKGLVQEEILFLMNPELIVSRLFTEKLNDNECLKITGAQIYSCYSGYSDAFEWRGPYSDESERDEWRRRRRQIIAIDALHFKNHTDQYNEGSIKRELNKAYCGFRENDVHPDYLPSIATGNWGCGAFNGDYKLKALIQMMAAAVVKRDLAYFTFGNRNQAEQIRKMHQHLTDHRVTVGHLFSLLRDYCKHQTAGDLYRFIIARTEAKQTRESLL